MTDDNKPDHSGQISEDEKPDHGTQNLEVKSLLRAFDESGIGFRDRAAALRLFKEAGHNVTFNEETGEAQTMYRSVTMPLSQALTAFAIENRKDEALGVDVGQVA